MVVAALVRVGLGVPAAVRVLLNVARGNSSCAAAGISTAEGREGICTRGIGLLGPRTVYNVVDRGHVLRMPEYQARLLGSRVTPTHVSNASEHEGLYPGGRGQLVSLLVMVTNTSARPLPFGAGVAYYSPVPSYPAHPLIELALPSTTGSNSDRDTDYPAIVNGRGAPTPTVFRQPLIAPHESVTGWVTFVAPAWALSVLHARPADVDFSRANGDSHYVGQIRLWK